MFEAAANFGGLNTQSKHCRYPAVNDARERLFQSINHVECLTMRTSAYLFPLL